MHNILPSCHAINFKSKSEHCGGGISIKVDCKWELRYLKKPLTESFIQGSLMSPPAGSYLVENHFLDRSLQTGGR